MDVTFFLSDGLMQYLSYELPTQSYLIDYLKGKNEFLFCCKLIKFIKIIKVNILYFVLNRGYHGKKLEDNIDCEIFGTIFEEAIDSYKKDLVFELSSNDPDEMEKNVDNIVQWILNWKEKNTVA